MPRRKFMKKAFLLLLPFLLTSCSIDASLLEEYSELVYGSSSSHTSSTSNPPSGSSCYLSNYNIQLNQGETFQLYVYVGSKKVYSAIWDTSNSAVAQVDNTGFVTAINPGTATIYASYQGTIMMCSVSVNGETSTESDLSTFIIENAEYNDSYYCYTHDTNTNLYMLYFYGETPAFEAYCVLSSETVDGLTKEYWVDIRFSTLGDISHAQFNCGYYESTSSNGHSWDLTVNSSTFGINSSHELIMVAANPIITKETSSFDSEYPLSIDEDEFKSNIFSYFWTLNFYTNNFLHQLDSTYYLF